MKKIILGVFVLFLAIFVSGCGKNQAQEEEKVVYNYKNKDLGFEIEFPEEFIYYQTQRKDTDNYTDIEFFVPTADTAYPQEVQSYAKPVVIRIFNQDTWGDNEVENVVYEEIGRKKDKVYTIRFWTSIPVDWEEKWTDEMKNNIKASFKL